MDVTLQDSFAQGDSILHAFFTMMTFSGGGPKSHTTQLVRFPDTILYAYSKPIFWYYTGKDGTLRMKDKSRINSKSISESFDRKGRSVSGVNVWYYQAASPTEMAVSTPGKDGTLKFLQQMKGRGALQLFIDGKHHLGVDCPHVIVTCHWTPRSFFIEQMVSSHSLSDQSVPMDKRCSLSKEDVVFSSKALRSQAVANRFHAVCEECAVHLQTIFGYNVTSMVLKCKMDSNDVVWVLWCESLSMTHPRRPGMEIRSDLVHTVAVKTAPPRVDRTPVHRLHPADSGATEMRMCPICRGDSLVGTMPHIQKKWLLFALSFLDHHCDAPKCPPDLKEDSEVPPSVLLLHPELSYREFVRLRLKPEWLNEAVALCQKCLESAITAINVMNDPKEAHRYQAAEWLQLKPVEEQPGSTRHSLSVGRRSLLFNNMMGMSPGSRQDASMGRLALSPRRYKRTNEPQKVTVDSIRERLEADVLRSRFVARIAAAQKKEEDAADVYEKNKTTGVMTKVGFGRPHYEQPLRANAVPEAAFDAKLLQKKLCEVPPRDDIAAEMDAFGEDCASDVALMAALLRISSPDHLDYEPKPATAPAKTPNPTPR